MRKRSEAGGQQPDPADLKLQQALKIPHDAMNEQILLAAAIVDDAARGELSRIAADNFFGDGHPEAWAAMLECVRRKLKPTPATLRQLAGGAVNERYLEQLVSLRPAAPPNLRHHVAALEWDRARAESVRGPIKELLRTLQDPSTDPERVRALARAVEGSFRGHGRRLKYLHDPAQLVRDQMKEVRARRRRRACYPYGIEGLDMGDNGVWRMVPGSAPGQVTVVTGVPGSGKSTTVARMVLAWVVAQRRVLYAAWEMQGGLTLELLATMSLGWSRYDVTTGNLTDEQEDRLEAEMARLSAWVRFWKLPWGREPGKKWTNDSALDDVHGHVADSGCEVGVFDLFKRCLRSTRPDEEESALIRAQTIADETRTHFVLVQQQRMKDIEQRPDKRPTREGIKGSGAWTEVADTIIGVHRPALWKNIDDDVLELDVLKQRYGRWPIAVEFEWDGERGSLTNGTEVDYDPPGARPRSEMETWIEEEGQDKKGRRRK